MTRLRPLLFLAILASPAFAAPVTAERLDGMPPAESAAWHQYLEKSKSLAAADEAALRAEVEAAGLPAALKAPSGGDFKVSHDAGDAWYGSEEAKHLADAILSYQTPAGGWSKHLGFGKGPRQPGMQWSSQNEPGQPAHYLATFDNNSTTAEMEFLANVWLATKREDCKAAYLKGLGFIFAAQYPNGGWPQVYPLEGAYHDDVTYNDNAITNILALLNRAASVDFLDGPTRGKAADSLAAGIRCVLATQVEVDGTKTVWCAQYDPLTLQPSAARKMEPATLSGMESARTLKFLMSLPDPSPEVIACVESGLRWFDDAKISGIGKGEVDGKSVYISVPESTDTLWARFYDLKTGKPVFPGRDGVSYATFEAMAAKNKVGYDYYTSQPASVLTNGRKKWLKMLEVRAGH